VRATLEAEWQAAKERHDQIKRQQASSSTGAPLNIGDAELGELVELSRRIEPLWDAATTTNEDRKRLLHAVLSRAEIERYREECVDLKIVWIAGLEETHRAIRSKGIDAAVRELRGAGYTDSKATEVLQARGVVPRGNGRLCRSVITHRITRQGLQHRETWR